MPIARDTRGSIFLHEGTTVISAPMFLAIRIVPLQVCTKDLVCVEIS